MANREGKCPKCGGNLSIPEGLLKFSCMYCGASLKQEELILPNSREKRNQASDMEEKLRELWENDREAAEELIDQILDLDEYNSTANEIYVRMHFDDLIFKYSDAMEYFTRSEYAPYFDKYRIKCRPIIETTDRYALEAADHGSQFMRQLAVGLVKAIDDSIEADKGLRFRGAKIARQDRYKMILAVYTIPMIRELKLGISEELSDMIVEEWMKAHPKSVLRKGTYAEMAAGFRKGKLCFITTAVCESFGKPDDCYELTSFRSFRDTYMSGTDRGRKLVEEYYDIAPGIVTCINMEADAAAVYKTVWETWLKPCLKDLEAGEEKACENRYAQMVKTLKEKYLS